MNAVHVETHCQLRERLRRFEPVYWWLEYWGDWLGPAGDQDFPDFELSPLAKAMKRGRDYIAATSERDQWNEDLRMLEKSLGRLKIRERARDERISGYVVLYLLHNRKWALYQIETRFRVTWREIDNRLWYAYSYLEAGLDHIAPGMIHRPAPIWQ
jgi:hypothetical protein